MKKLIALILCLVLSVSLLYGCKNADNTQETEITTGNTSVGQKLEPTENAEPAPSDPVPPTTTTAPATEAPAPITPAPATPTTNEFFNDSNSFYDADNVSIRPRHLYWEGDKLVAECFVTNGKSTTAYNITVKKLAFGNANGTFADGGFGAIEGLTVPAYGYTIWTFTFSGDAVTNPGADLSSLRYESSVSFSH